MTGMADTGEQGHAANTAPDTPQKHHRFDLPDRTREGDRKPWKFQDLVDHLYTWGDIKLPVLDEADEGDTVAGDDESAEEVHADGDGGNDSVSVKRKAKKVKQTTTPRAKTSTQSETAQANQAVPCEDEKFGASKL
ncbi:hypothetical protein CBER1_11456 [Cercospora berteroae]|uniref:Uncharacterized protein n=1 Tax=Cercospora berteroae TaxID=357750 RepID=A0A2S6C049_9PEZI|nr:hypothetical protein CBER1_11456 [Cercospora berteroae]